MIISLLLLPQLSGAQTPTTNRKPAIVSKGNFGLGINMPIFHNRMKEGNHIHRENDIVSLLSFAGSGAKGASKMNDAHMKYKRTFCRAYIEESDRIFFTPYIAIHAVSDLNVPDNKGNLYYPEFSFLYGLNVSSNRKFPFSIRTTHKINAIQDGRNGADNFWFEFDIGFLENPATVKKFRPTVGFGKVADDLTGHYAARTGLSMQFDYLKAIFDVNFYSIFLGDAGNGRDIKYEGSLFATFLNNKIRIGCIYKNYDDFDQRVIEYRDLLPADWMVKAGAKFGQTDVSLFYSDDGRPFFGLALNFYTENWKKNKRSKKRKSPNKL